MKLHSIQLEDSAEIYGVHIWASETLEAADPTPKIIRAGWIPGNQVFYPGLLKSIWRGQQQTIHFKAFSLKFCLW